MLNFQGPIPANFLLVGTNIQPTVGRKNEQIQRHSNFGRYFKRLGQGEGYQNYSGCIQEPN